MKIFIFLLVVGNIFAYESVQIDMHGGSYENSSFMDKKSNYSNHKLSISSFRDNNSSRKTISKQKK